MYKDILVHNKGEAGLSQQEKMNLKIRMRINMEMRRRGIFPKENPCQPTSG